MSRMVGRIRNTPASVVDVTSIVRYQSPSETSQNSWSVKTAPVEAAVDPRAEKQYWEVGLSSGTPPLS